MDLLTNPTWADLGLRLLLTVIASALLGYDREARGHAAGLRTTMLVGLAAAVAMIQANLLLTASGKSASSFATMDVMRLPLGVLTGVGFIGGGAILKHGNSVSGVTTAATLWIVTAISLCFGGGQVVVGIAATLIGWTVLWAVKKVELRVPHTHKGVLTILLPNQSLPPNLDAIVVPLGGCVRLAALKTTDDMKHVRFSFTVRWTQAADEPIRLEMISQISRQYTVESFTVQSESVS